MSFRNGSDRPPRSFLRPRTGPPASGEPAVAAEAAGRADAGPAADAAVSAAPAEPDVPAAAADGLWNAGVTERHYARGREKYQSAVMEQYKLCVEMADRVSARRNLANTFFLSLNSAVVAAASAVAGHGWRQAPPLLVFAGLLILLGECLAWFLMMRSYRQLNHAKWEVIGLLERRLPARAYSDAEWGMLGRGRDFRRYIPLTIVEQGIPIFFAVAYLLGYAAAVG